MDLQKKTGRGRVGTLCLRNVYKLAWLEQKHYHKQSTSAEEI